MSILPSWPSSKEFYAVASRPEGIGSFDYLAAHRSVRRHDREYRFRLYRQHGIGALYLLCYLPSWFVARFLQHHWISLPLGLLFAVMVVLVATPIYAKSCVRYGAIQKRKVLAQLERNVQRD